MTKSSGVSILSIIVCFSILISCSTKVVEVKSPSENLGLKFKNDSTGLKLFVYNEEKLLSTIDAAQFIFDNESSGPYEISNFLESFVDEEWNPVYGERSQIIDRYNGITLTLENPDNNISIDLECRLYDEGLAFRYIFDTLEMAHIRLLKELTTFNFDNDYKAWVSDRAQSEYRKVRISEIKSSAERPLVVEMNDSSYLALGEAALVDYGRMKFKSGKNNSLLVDLTDEVDLKKSGNKSPWRYVMIADSAGELLENNFFVQNLNEPNEIEDLSWIKPGKVIREVTLTTQGGLACVDFAAKHNLQYVEFDAGWYGNEYDDSSDASTITVDPKRSPGPLDMHKVIEYAKQKDIGIILYINRRAMEKQLDEVLPLYQSWGIKGLKYGFVNVGPQEWTSWLHEAVRKAADYELMVDIHDEYRPTGYSRTYPNLMTQEGIRGDEESPSTEHTLITLFTRMIAGAGDNTNCYMAERVSQKMGGKAAQMAKAIMIYSPWQFLYWYDRPQGSPSKTGGAGAAEGFIPESAELDFYANLPTVWDDTKVLNGKIGEFAAIVRKSGNNWYLGILVAKKDRIVEIPLSFLDKDTEYEAVIYSQNGVGLEENRVRISRQILDNESNLSVSITKDSGAAVIFKKK